jgi:DNA-binding transcriptional regulator YiaG
LQKLAALGKNLEVAMVRKTHKDDVVKSTEEIERDARRKQMGPAELKELLDLKGWLQLDLAREIDVSEATVSNWMKGIFSPPTATAMFLKQMLVEARAAKATAPKPSKRVVAKSA